jgi:hypothetical protein
MENVRRALLQAHEASASRIGGVVKPRTNKQKARRFIAWRKRVFGRDS